MTALVASLGGVVAFARRADRVLLTLLLLFAGLLAALPEQALESLRFTGESLVSIAPYLGLSIAVAAAAKATGADRVVARVFAGRPTTMIFAAAGFGALSPFCSCGVIPLIAALLAAGVPLPPVMAFWIASPLMDPQMFVLTAATLGLPFAAAKTLAAFTLGFAAGFATLAVQRFGGFAQPLRDGVGDGGCAGSTVRRPGVLVWAFWREPDRRAQFGREALATGVFLGKWLALAFALESLMIAYLPTETVAAWLGGSSVWAVPLSVIVGVPTYLNGYAALPVVSGLIEIGMAPGAAMAFLIAGGVTSIPAAIAVYALARPPVFAWYLALALVGSTLVGFAYDLVAGA